MNLIKTKPVATLMAVGTTTLAVLTVLLATGVLPPRWAAVASAVVAALNLLLGGKVHAAVTPLVKPRDASGRALVPVSGNVPPRNPS